jgi:small subunit ribosomal protein S16
MLMIRLARFGVRKKPVYRVVVIEKDRARNGRSIELVGLYNPRTNPATVDLKRERIDYWVSKGAQLSERVEKLMKHAPVAAEAPAAPAAKTPQAKTPEAKAPEAPAAVETAPVAEAAAEAPAAEAEATEAPAEATA